MQRGATIGAFTGFCGATISAIMLGLTELFTHKLVFGISGITGFILVAVLLVIIVIDAVLGALGGALVVKFIKDV